MIELHQYPPIWGLPSLSPFCIKVEAFLRRMEIPYRIVVEKNPARGPKGKMPFILDGSEMVPDSSFIFEYLIRTKKLKNMVAFDPIVQAQGLAFKRMVEEHLYFVLLYSRWIDPIGWKIARSDFSKLFPLLIGTPFLHLIRNNLRRQAYEQGLGRHSLKEVYEIGHRDIEALAVFLGDKPFFLGDRWTTLDATVYAFLITILRQPIESKLKSSLLGHKNLVLYCEREEKACFPELV